MKATYLLAVAFLEILRLGHHGGLLVGTQLGVDQRSGLTCVFKYLEAPNLPSDLYQCLTAILHCAFNAALTWLVVVTAYFLCVCHYVHPAQFVFWFMNV